MPRSDDIPSWLHIGDLQVTEATGENPVDLKRTVALVSALPDGVLNFVLLPSDNADDGEPDQFTLAGHRQAVLLA